MSNTRKKLRVIRRRRHSNDRKENLVNSTRRSDYAVFCYFCLGCFRIGRKCKCRIPVLQQMDSAIF
ncbi:Hypothetical protein FKW44_018316, partial [Caligus rogercresseyi]